MLSQHSRSQALVKEEGCVRRGEPTLNLAILMEMKPERKSHHHLKDKYNKFMAYRGIINYTILFSLFIFIKQLVLVSRKRDMIFET